MRRCARRRLVPRVGIEPTLLAERDFESRASTNFATEAGACSRRAVCHTGRRLSRSTRLARRTPRMPPLPPVTQALLLANVAIFFLDQLLGREPGRCCSRSGRSARGFWPWQVVSYAFLHGDFNHLFFNMLGLWMFGGELEQVWGQKRFLQFYAASVVAAALTQLLVNCAARRDGADDRRLGRPVRPAARVRDDLSEPDHPALLRHPDEGQVAGRALRPDRALPGRLRA